MVLGRKTIFFSSMACRTLHANWTQCAIKFKRKLKRTWSWKRDVFRRGFQEKLELEREERVWSKYIVYMHEIVRDKKQGQLDIKEALCFFVSKRGHSHVQNLQFDAIPQCCSLFYFSFALHRSLTAFFFLWDYKGGDVDLCTYLIWLIQFYFAVHILRWVNWK